MRHAPGSPILHLRSGRYFGAPRLERRTGRLRLIESQYVPGESLPRHAHEAAYLCVVLEGTFAENALRREHECGRGTLIFNAAGEAHSDEFCPRGGRVLNIELERGLARGWLGDADGGLEPLRYAFAGAALRHVGRIEAELWHWDRDSGLVVEAAACELLSELGRAAVRERRAPPWLGRVKALLRERLCESVELDELAREAGVHAAHLSRTFQRYEGCGPGEYLRVLRIDAAWQAVRAGRRPLSQIAGDCGFSDQSHMTRLVRASYGVSPGRARRQACPAPTRSA
jgi:AraC family transcriptional regulator